MFGKLSPKWCAYNLLVQFVPETLKPADVSHAMQKGQFTHFTLHKAEGVANLHPRQREIIFPDTNQHNESFQLLMTRVMDGPIVTMDHLSEEKHTNLVRTTIVRN